MPPFHAAREKELHCPGPTRYSSILIELLLTVYGTCALVAFMNFDSAAEKLLELGSPVRLAVLHFLLEAGEEGLSGSELQTRLQIPKSTLSHHVSQLVAVGLVSRVKEGRIRRCRANRKEMQNLIAFLLRDCDGVPSEQQAATE
jgi:ArsR family transcriptional regulator